MNPTLRGSAAIWFSPGRVQRCLASGLLLLALTASAADAPPKSELPPPWLAQVRPALVVELGASEVNRTRLEKGLAQVAARWREADGDQAAFSAFVHEQFAATDAARNALFNRFSHNLEQVNGHLHEVSRELHTPSDLDTGPIQPFDNLFGAWDPSAHVLDDWYANKLAFVALLNFPLSTLSERLAQGPTWTRRQWAETKLAEAVSRRVPAEVNQGIADAGNEAGNYIAGYNIWMHHVLDEQGKPIFPKGLKLLSHWNLRDEIKAEYSEGAAALPKQRAIQQVMARIVTQEIPQAVIDNPAVDWNPLSNAVSATADYDGSGSKPASADVSGAREPDTRYARWLANFQAQRKLDPYAPEAPTLIARRFDEERQLPEARVQSMLEQVLSAPEVAEVAKRIAQRLGRPLEPFDLWYNGFRPRGKYTESELDRMVAKKYPSAAAYARDIPNLLIKLGFAPAVARRVAANIVVDAARGSGHAMGAEMRTEKAHLRTRVVPGGMNYKGYNIAVHEMGHNVEQTFSLNDIDYYSLQGVPNTAFTEALAFTFQNRDLELLGLSKPDAQSEALKTLNDFWGTYEIAGVALVDMGVWHWLYEHPDATPATLRAALVQIAKDTWNKYYAPVFGVRDVVLLGVYSHMINETLYLPDYPIGHMIAFQVEAEMNKAGAGKGYFGKTFERVARQGAISPDLWMIQATGKPVGPQALLAATREALRH